MPLPPGPPGPALVQSALLVRDPLGFLERCIRRYGDVFTIRFVGMGNLVYVADPGILKEVFTGDPELFHAGEANRFMEPVLGPQSVLLLDEEAHLQQRRLLLAPFHGEKVRRYADLVAEIVAREVEGWPVGRTFSLRPRMQAVTLEVILLTVFGIRDAERLARLRELIPRLLRHGNLIVWLPWLHRDLGPLSPWRMFKRMRDAVDEILYDEIRRRRELDDLAERDDVLSLLLLARDEQGRPMSDAELHDELMTLLLAGHETTATGLAWAFERLLRHPAALARLVDEVDAGEGDDYLDAVVKETLRVRPVVYDVARLLTAPFSVRGWVLPPGTYLVPSITGVHLFAGLYSEAGEFQPERFLAAQPESYAWIPFGGGRRRCIGAAFATMEMKATLREVLSRVTLSAPKAASEKVRLHNVTLVPARWTRVVVDERRPAPSLGTRGAGAQAVAAA
jgi:cytochrome P450 family 135